MKKNKNAPYSAIPFRRHFNLPALRIGVCGPHKCSEEEMELGREVGAEIARKEAILVCGGLGGMMTAAAEGAKSEHGLTVGLLPGDSAAEANPYIDIPLPTGLGAVRNAILVRACDVVIAIKGEYGTLSEIAFALRLKVPVVGLRTWSVVKEGKADPRIHVADSPKEAVDLAVKVGRGIPL